MHRRTSQFPAVTHEIALCRELAYIVFTGTMTVVLAIVLT